MFHLHRTFELSLRGREPSPSKTKANLAIIHKQCKGKAHASGQTDPAPRTILKSESNSSIRSRDSRGSAVDCFIEIRNAESLNTNGNGKDIPDYGKSFSTSSMEGHSDTDSSDNTKSECSKHTLDSQGQSNASDRLYHMSTKASLAKMRFMDEDHPHFSSEESNESSKKSDEAHKNCKDSAIFFDRKDARRSSGRISFREKQIGIVTVDDVKADGLTDDGNQLIKDEKRKPLERKPSINENGDKRPNGFPEGEKPPIPGNKPSLVRRNFNSPNQSTRTGSFRNSSPSPSARPPWNSIHAKAAPSGSPGQGLVRTGSLRSSIKKKPNIMESLFWLDIVDIAERRKFGWGLDTGKDGEGLLKDLSNMGADMQDAENNKVITNFFNTFY